MEKKDFRTYRRTFLKGIDDLYSINPYVTPSAYDWGWETKFMPHFGVTEEEYLRDIKGYEHKIKFHNESYIEKLKATGEYGKEDYQEIKLIHNSMFDDPKILEPIIPTSHRIVFLDMNKDGK